MLQAMLVFVGLFLLLTEGCGHGINYYLERGNKLYAAGKADAASIEYRKALQQDPKSGEAYYRLGLSQIAEKKLPDAYQSLTRAVELVPGNDDANAKLAEVAFQGYIRDPRRAVLYNQVIKIAEQLLAKDANSFDGLRFKGSLALADRKVEEAVQFLRRANEIKPTDPDVTVALSQALFLDQKSEEGEKLAYGLIEKNKAFGPIYDVLYRHYAAANRLSDAERILRAKADNNPKQADYTLELASYYARAKRPMEMTNALQRLLDHTKEFPDAHLMVGNFYGAIGDWTAAISQFDEGVRSNPKGALPYNKRKVAALLAQGKKADASQILDMVLKDHPKDVEARAIKGAMLLDRGNPGDLDASLVELQAVAKDRPDDAVMHFNLGRAELAKGDAAAARTEFQEAIRRRVNYLPPRFALANISMNQQKPADALRYANDILVYDPSNSEAKLLRTAALAGMGNYDDARLGLTQFLREFPDSEDAKIQVATIAIAQKKFKEAEGIFGKLRQTHQNDIRSAAGLAQTYAAEQQIDKAVQLLNEELKSSPDSTSLRMLLASTALRGGQYDLAIAEYRQVLDQNPKSAAASLRLGDAYLRKGAINDAIAMLRKAQQLAPKDPAPSMLLADTLTANGRAAEAVPEYRHLLELHPNDAALQNSLAFAISETGGNLDEAQRLVQTALRKFPGEPDFGDTLGSIYLKRGMKDSALQVFQSLTRQDPRNPTFRYHLGMALLAKGDNAGAKNELNEALTHQPSPDQRRTIAELLAKLN